jgi:hypothetical protein
MCILFYLPSLDTLWLGHLLGWLEAKKTWEKTTNVILGLSYC